jgi:hypothetical protein
VLNLANGRLGITMGTVIVDEGPHVVVDGNGNILQDDVIFGLNNIDRFCNVYQGTKEVTSRPTK